MTLAAIAAVARNGVIGAKGGMPWHIPEDFRYFKRMTLGKAVIMGRATYLSLGGPLPGRTNIVLTSRPEDLAGSDAVPVVDIDAALAVATQAGQEPMVIGGAVVYEAFLPRLERLYLTHIDRDYDGDTFFPQVDWSEWALTAEDKRDGDPPFAFRTYDRRA